MPNKYRRVVCTGIGLVSPLGVGVDRSWQALISLKSGIKSLRDVHSYEGCKSRVAAYIDEDEFNNSIKCDDHSYIEKNIRQLSRATIYGLLSTHEALKCAKLLDKSSEHIVERFSERTGVAIGQGMVDFEDIYENAAHLQSSSDGKKGNPRRISPFFMTRALINMSSGNVSIRYKLMGPNSCASTACATGGHSIGEAFNLIKSNKADIMVCGSTESCINKLSIAGFERLRALSCNFNDVPSEASRPFDTQRCGFVMGEGSGILILEELEHALRRGIVSTDIFGEILGFGSTSDAHHLTAPLPDGSGALRSMQLALDDANLEPDSINLINAHATSTPMGDEIECSAIETLFEPFLCSSSSRTNIPVVSYKGALGHLLGAAGSVEAIFGLLSIKHGIIPPCLNLDSPLKTSRNLVEFITGEPRKWTEERRVLLKNSFGFGGTNATLVMSNYFD